ncbi:hypothetical protein F3Y22_tig00011761pilonHSYRG00178 [Hibiscus syriacus]|uniref:Uncharacterized protein n=1 Tax=Hibiscus syriacus TaxID=106335 RepID=A0A6A3C7F6_HIBSY|nr:hypothetical protein F3Y22_tig00011761pilonHSYRG00178 [Hibiscus syriacus]
MGKNPSSFIRSSSRKRRSKHKKDAQSPALLTIGAVASSSTLPPSSANSNGGVVGLAAKAKKKATGARLWMRFDVKGASELVEYDKSTIIQKASLPARDLRIIGPIFSQSSTIIAREKAMVVNLEFVKATVTASEVLILDPLQQEWNACSDTRSGTDGGLVVRASIRVSGSQDSVRGRLLTSGLKGGGPRNGFLSGVGRIGSKRQHQEPRVRDDIEHLPDDNEDMAHLYLTRKQVHNLQLEALLRDEFPNTSCNHPPRLPRLGSARIGV